MYALPELQKQVVIERGEIDDATTQGAPKERLGYLWAVLAVDYRKAGNFQASEAAYLRAIELQRDVVSVRRNYATTLDNLGTLYLMYGRMDEAERYNRMGYAARKDLGNRLELARSQEHFAEIELARHKFKQTEAAAQEALAWMEAENDPEPLDRIGALNALTFSRCMQRRCQQGRENARASLEMATSQFGPRSMPAAHALMAVGFAAWKSGHLEEAEQTMRAAISIMEEQRIPAGRALLLALMQYRNFLQSQLRTEDVESIDRQLVAAKQENGYCKDCVNIRSLR